MENGMGCCSLYREGIFLGMFLSTNSELSYRLFFLLLLLLLQQHVLAQLEAVADSSTPARPPIKRLELKLVLGP